MATLKQQRDRLRSVLNEAAAYRYSAFKLGDPINGGDLLEWFTTWRIRALRELDHIALEDERPALRKKERAAKELAKPRKRKVRARSPGPAS